MALPLLLLLGVTVGGCNGLRWPLEHLPTQPRPGVFDVTKFGARADNRSDNTAAFTAALKALAAAGGGTLLVPRGGIYLTLPLNLTTSGTRLRVKAGATLKALCGPDGAPSPLWPQMPMLPSYGAGVMWSVPFVGAADVTDIFLDGGGVIDSSGYCWWGRKVDRPRLLQLRRVRRAELSNLLFTNSPKWTLHLWDSEDLHLHDIKVLNPASSDNAELFFGPETDGVDIDSSRRVLLEDSTFHTGDDCVVLKSGKDAAGRAFGQPTANVLIRNVTLEACSCLKHSSGGLHGGRHWYDGCGALKLGTEMSGGIANVTLEDSRVVYAGAVLKMLSPKRRGGYIKNVTWQRISAQESGGLLWLQISGGSNLTEENAIVSDVSVLNVTLEKLSCRFRTALRPQTDCEFAGVLDMNKRAPPVSVRMEGIVVREGAAGWSCSGPKLRLTASSAGLRTATGADCQRDKFPAPRNSAKRPRQRRRRKRHGPGL